MAGLTSIEATDSKSNAYLRDPACGIPFDVHFEIEDMEGATLGRVGGHKPIMALKSPVFRQCSMDFLQKGTQSRSRTPQCLLSRGCCPTCMMLPGIGDHGR